MIPWCSSEAIEKKDHRLGVQVTEALCCRVVAKSQRPEGVDWLRINRRGDGGQPRVLRREPPAASFCFTFHLDQVASSILG